MPGENFQDLPIRTLAYRRHLRLRRRNFCSLHSPDSRSPLSVSRTAYSPRPRYCISSGSASITPSASSTRCVTKAATSPIVSCSR